MNGDTTIIEIMNLHPLEMNLLKILRKGFKFGEVTITMRDGLPFRLRRTTEYADLTSRGDT